MNNEEFLKRLSEVAEWHRPQCGPMGSVSMSKGRERAKIEHPGAVTELELMEMTEEEITDYHERLMLWREAQPNASVQPEIIELKVYARKCDGCERSCDSTRRVERKFYQSGAGHWREFCTYCECYKDPRTNQYSVPRDAGGQFFGNLFRRDKPMPKVRLPKPPKVPKPLGRPKKLSKTQIMEQLISEGTWEVKETEDSVTRVFVPKK